MDPLSILIVGRDPATNERLAAEVAACGLGTAVRATDVASAQTCLREAGAVLLDARSFSDDDAGRVVSDAAGAAHPVPCLVGLDEPSVDETVAWMRRGAFGVVPVRPHAETLRMQLEQALRHRELSARNAELERSLEVHERLAMIGKLAAGVAHELNNPLDGVLRYVNLSIEKLPREAPQVTYLMEARRGLRRMADIIKDLLQFSRNASLETADEDAERLARDSVTQVVGSVRDRTIATAFEFPPTGIHLPRGMFQVFGNLAKNAVDAMPEGGSIRVAATLASGRVLITVTDTGTGIPDEIRERIFEPFFTTKEVGKGTGLGLPICQRIVERLGGTLSLETEIGRGTIVRMDLPQRRSAVAPQSAQPSARRPAVSARAEGAF
jgi:signal transduction histidine kinase